MPRKYEPPDFVKAKDNNPVPDYGRWLQRKAAAMVRRDRKRGNATAMVAGYKLAIHRAVQRCEGKDWYTGEELDWHLLSTYDNELSKGNGRSYKATFANLPTVDHVGDGTGTADFVICGWAVNDAKNDLDYRCFIALCRAVIRYAEERRRPEASFQLEG